MAIFFYVYLILAVFYPVYFMCVSVIETMLMVIFILFYSFTEPFYLVGLMYLRRLERILILVLIIFLWLLRWFYFLYSFYMWDFVAASMLEISFYFFMIPAVFIYFFYVREGKSGWSYWFLFHFYCLYYDLLFFSYSLICEIL
jgi:hypothetical protein